MVLPPRRALVLALPALPAHRQQTQYAFDQDRLLAGSQPQSLVAGKVRDRVGPLLQVPRIGDRQVVEVFILLRDRERLRIDQVIEGALAAN